MVGTPARRPRQNARMPTSVLWLNRELATTPSEIAQPGHGAKISSSSSDWRVLATPRLPERPPGTRVENQLSSCTVSQKPAAAPSMKATKMMRMCQRALRTAAGKRAQELPARLEQGGLRAVDHQIGPQRQVLEIEQQVAVERDRARDRERRERRAVELRQPVELLGREHAHAALLAGVDQPLELLPALLALAAELVALERDDRPPGGVIGDLVAMSMSSSHQPRCLIRR